MVGKVTFFFDLEEKFHCFIFSCLLMYALLEFFLLYQLNIKDMAYKVMTTQVLQVRGLLLATSCCQFRSQWVKRNLPVSWSLIGILWVTFCNKGFTWDCITHVHISNVIYVTQHIGMGRTFNISINICVFSIVIVYLHSKSNSLFLIMCNWRSLSIVQEENVAAIPRHEAILAFV